MITLFMIIGAVAFFGAVMFAPNSTWRLVLGVVTGIIFVGSTAMITANYHSHFGMHQVTTTKTTKIYPVNDKLPAILYQPVGTNGQDDVYLYKTSTKQKKPVHTQANEFTNNKLVFTNQTNATLTTKETRWRFKNGFYKWLFMGTKMDGSLVKRTNTFKYPKTYVKVFVQQAQKLQQVK